MANFTWTVVNSAGTVTQDGPTITDQNMARFTDYCWARFPQLDENGDPKTKNNANIAAAVRDWMTQQWQDTKSMVIEYERLRDAAAARDAVGDIE